MVAVRSLLSTLNNLAHAGLLATGRLRPTDDDGAGLPDPWRDDVQMGEEPRLEDLLDDPVVHLMMRADRLEPDQVRRLMTSVRREARS
jgi:hypothetical protein